MILTRLLITVSRPMNCVARKMWGIHDAVRAHKAHRHFRVSLTSIQVFPEGIYTAVLSVREKTIGVIIVEMCGKCSHFRLMLAVEETKIAHQKHAKNISLQRKLRAIAAWECT